jgi:hypothetical protein
VDRRLIMQQKRQYQRILGLAAFSRDSELLNTRPGRSTIPTAPSKTGRQDREYMDSLKSKRGKKSLAVAIVTISGRPKAQLSRAQRKSAITLLNIGKASDTPETGHAIRSRHKSSSGLAAGGFSCTTPSRMDRTDQNAGSALSLRLAWG